MAFEIGNPGLATTVQDQGRTGHYNVGIPQSGSMDQYSAELGNALVGNTAREAVLECTYLGPVLTTDSDAVIAVTGAPVEVKVNGEPRPQWTRLELKTGGEVSLIGRGAGGPETASAILRDLIDIWHSVESHRT